MSWDSEAGSSGAHGQGRGVDDPGAPVLLASFYDHLEAEIVVAKLRSAGIESFIKHEALSVVYGLTVDGCGQQDVMVRAEDLEVAQAALDAE
jgi:hypothetical protein